MPADVAPLSGVRVLDVSSYLAGPFAGLMLSDLGATVLKVEASPAGDPYRKFSPRVNGVGVSAAVVNRGKRSVMLDLKSDSGRDNFLELTREADVVLESWRPGVAERLGLDRETLSAANPRVVHVSVTGYGESGPCSDRRAFDNIIQAESGIGRLDPSVGFTPPFRTYLADKSTSGYAVQAALAGLLRRERTGKGGFVAVAMIDAISYFNFPDLLAEHAPAGSLPLEAPSSFTNSVIRTSDGFVAVAPAGGTQVRALCEVLGHPEWVAELRALGSGAAFRQRLFERMESAAADLSSEDFAARVRARDVPAAVVLDAEEHFRHPQIVHNGTYQRGKDPSWGTYRYPRYPALFDGVAHEPSSQLSAAGADDADPWGDRNVSGIRSDPMTSPNQAEELP